MSSVVAIFERTQLGKFIKAVRNAVPDISGTLHKSKRS